MIFRTFFVSCFLSFLVGCSSSSMMVASQQTLSVPSKNEAQVIFMRSSFIGSAVSASIYDVTNKNIKFIGILDNGKKLIYSVDPGKHTFMVVSEAADFMEADLSPGKNYYSITTPRMGVWKARFSLWPIKSDPNAEYNTSMKKFDQWENNTKIVQNTEQSRTWYENNKESVRLKFEEYWPKWKDITQENLLKRTLVPEDGM